MFENLFQWFLVIIFILWLLSIVRFLFCDPFRWYRNTDGESMPIEGEVITLVRVNINGFRYDAL